MILCLYKDRKVDKMRILAIGDIVGLSTLEYIKERLWRVRSENSIDLTVANGENTNDIHGLGADEAEALLSYGVDVITGGNHTFSRKDIYSFLEGSSEVIRPCNYPPTAPGNGYSILNVNGYRVLVINVLGTAFMEPLASPIESVQRILERENGAFDISILDIHAESTSEKLAIAYYFDGKINVIFGTHTHVETADEKILLNGSGYITDLGMTGPCEGILGVDRECIINRYITHLPQKFNIAGGKIEGHGAIFDVDESSGRVRSVKRIVF